MGFAALLTGFISTVAQVGRAVIGVAIPVSKVIVQSAKDLVNGVVASFEKGVRTDPQSARQHAERELQQVNDEIAVLKKLYLANQRLNSEQDQRWHELRSRRDVLNGEITAIDKFTTAQEIIKEEEHYRPIVISDANAHVLQYHVGQSTHNKMCVCGRDMVLQWNRATVTAGLHDFFWGCSGYYIRVNNRAACERTQQLTFEDLNLFANLNRPEFGIESATLTREAINPVKARRIRQALDSIRGAQQSKKVGIVTYRCPIHGESLRLQRKNQASDQLLDAYFLGCPRWLPNNAGCNFLVKLKSAAQISSVLDTEHSTGVLGI